MSSDSPEKQFEKVRDMIRQFPTGPGLYFMKDAEDKVLYIGKAKNLRSRAGSYFQPSAKLEETRGAHIEEMIHKVARVDFLEAASEIDAILQEARLIKDIHPPYNTSLKDAKTFPYLEITTREPFPGVYVTRNPKNPRSKLFGPFTAGGELRGALNILQKIFKFRTCNLPIGDMDGKRQVFRPCLLYHIKQCTAPCANRVSKEDYRRQIRDLVRFLESKRSTVLRDLRMQMEEAANAQDYETAAVCRDRIRMIESLDKRGSVDKHIQPEAFAADPAEGLQKLQQQLKSDQAIRIIEGFDIAHLGGKETVGSMVQFIDGRPFREGYRRYRIKTVQGVNDYASLQEVLSRRYRRAMVGEELWPDLVLIDGGIGQLHAAEEVFRQMGAEPPNLCSIAKKEEIIFVHGQDKPLRLGANNPARKLLQYVRDESHRFAQHYHHILRRKSMLEE